MNKSTAALILVLLTASTALGVPLTYTVGSGSSVNANAGPGLLINTSMLVSPGTSFTLNDGGSQSFDFFAIWTPETFINPDDRVPMLITATLNFSDPITGAVVNGITFGGSALIFQGGRVEWQTPAPMFTLSDRTFSVTLSDEYFNVGVFGLFNGPGCGATVRATIRQITSVGKVEQVPENGGTAALLGFAAFGLVCFRRKFSCYGNR